jgi:hypothetical protein
MRRNVYRRQAQCPDLCKKRMPDGMGGMERLHDLAVNPRKRGMGRGKTQEELQTEYYIQHLQAACRQLAHSEEPLSRVLIEIIEDITDTSNGNSRV